MRPLGFLLILFSCNPPDTGGPDDSGGGGDADVDADSDSDADVDSDADTDVDTATDTGDGPVDTGTTAAICGNDLVEAGEDCDDANTASGDGCSEVCLDETAACVPMRLPAIGGGSLNDASIDNDIAALAMWGGGVQLRDTADPSILLSRILGLTGTYSVLLEQPWLYVSGSGNEGFRIFDVSDPAWPVEASSLYIDDSDYGILDMAMAGPDVVAFDSSGVRLIVIDITDPASPFIKGEVSLQDWYDNGSGGGDIQVVGDLVLVTSLYNAVYAVDISDRANPVEVWRLQDWDLMDARIDGNHLLARVSGVGLRVWDIATPTSPVVVFDAPVDPTGCSGSMLHLEGDELFMSDGCTMFSWDVTDPTSASLSWSYSALQITDMGGFDGTTAWLNSDRDIRVFDMSSSSVAELANVPVVAGSGLAVTDGDHLLVPGDRTAMQVVDTTDIWRLEVAAEYGQLGQRGTVLDLEGDLVALGMNSGQVELVDVTDRTAPVKLGDHVGFIQPIKYVDIDGDRLVVQARETLEILDISDPTTPTPIGSVATGRHTRVQRDGDLVAGWGAGGLTELIDISDSTAPAVVGSIPLGVLDGALMNDQLWLAYWVDGLRGFDVSDPTNPVEISQLEASVFGSANIDMVQPWMGYLLVGDWYTTWLVDISDPANPAIVWTFDFRLSDQVWQDGDLLWTSIGPAGPVIDMPGVCSATCGNFVAEFPEGCDDGNLADGDGCSALCEVE